MQQTLKISLFGHLQLQYNGELLRTIDTPRAQLLLAWLLLNRDTPQPRQQIAYHFWPDSPEKQARTNLRKVLYQLRQGLPQADQFLQIDNQTIGWCNNAPFVLDVAGFEAELTTAAQAAQAGKSTEQHQALAHAVTIYGGDLLASHYDDWLLTARERLRLQWITAINQLITHTEAQGDYRQAIQLAQQLLNHDPLHEAIYRHLMRLHQATGNRAAMLHTYHMCTTLLQRELAVEPSPATQQLYADLLANPAQAHTQPPMPSHTGAQATHSPRLADAITFPLTGREGVWHQVQVAWHQAHAGQTSLLLLTGEPGIGKTRLTEELVLWASRQGVATAVSHAYATECTVAYAPVLRWLRTETIQRTWDALPTAWLTELRRLLPELATRFPAVPPPPPLQEAWQRTRLLDALTQALLADPRPLLLVLEDLHWADRETLTWLPTLLRLDPSRPLLVVGTVRPAEVDKEHALSPLCYTLQRAGMMRELKLHPLTPQATTTLAEAVGGRALTQSEAAQLFHETEGNPLFIVEMMRANSAFGQSAAGTVAGSETGSKTEAEIEMETGPTDALTLPPRVEAVLQARLRQLTPATSEVIALAAVIGHDFTFALLAAVSEQNEDALIRALDEAWQRQIIREQGGDAYDFSHDKLRLVAYHNLSRLQRRRYHRRVAAALSKLSVSALPLVYSQIGYHHEQAGDL